ncbi:MAG: hypothetical protein Q8R29_02325 [bacterium]|nr:hypothetical protein [bacterium]
MAVESMAEQGVVKEDTVEAFWVIEDKDDERGGVYSTVKGFLVPSLNNLFFTPDLGVVEQGYRDHESGKWEIRLGEKIMAPTHIVFKVVNIANFRGQIDGWLKQVRL